MAPSPAALNDSLQQIIHYHLDNSSVDNALFFAERLVAQDTRSNVAIHLYALCHLRIGDFRSAYDVSKATGYRGSHLGTTWVFAQACLALERYKDGIVALEKSKGLWTQKCSLGRHSPTTRAEDPDLAALLCLLGKLHRGYGDKRKAVSCFEEAVKKNPFMWDAFTALCDMGISLRVPNVFKVNDLLVQSVENGASTAAGSDHGTVDTVDVRFRGSATRSPIDLMDDPFTASSEPPGSVTTMFTEGGGDFASRIQHARLRGAASSNSQVPMEGVETPTGTPSSDVATTRSGYSQEPPQAPARKGRSAPATDSGAEAPSRMNYRLGTKRNGRTHERAPEQPVEFMAEAANVQPGSMRSGSLGTADRKRTLSGHPVHRTTTHAEEPPTRRSARLNMFKPLAKSNAGATAGASAGRELKKARPPVSRILRPGTSVSSVGRVVSGNRKPLEDHADVDHGEMSRVKEIPPPMPTASRLVEQDTAKSEEVMRWIMDLLKRLGSGYYALSRFQCQEAVQAFSGLSPAHQATPWVLTQMGRAHYEQASYAEAEKYFRRLRVQAPSRLQDMEVYSTILWHLKRETDLSFLAHELIDAAWHSPQAWCALGNAWSLARDPEQALRCFKRATQLDPKFAYAFTLQGHEHVSNEEYDKALTAYRQAIAADRRHYNAYYGIGRVQERLGAYDRAHEHFYAASIINPNNAVLICCIGTVLEKQNNMEQALAAYTKAAELAPRAAQTRYKKARVMIALQMFDEARRELVVLKDVVPEEATVHFLLGNLYRRTNEKQLSARHFTIALSLDPKAAPKIKDAMERLEDEDVSMEDSMIA